MEQSQALRKLQESAELIKMVEELVLSGGADKLSSAVLGGLRITLRSVRENILESHDRLAEDFVEKARTQYDPKPHVNVEGASTTPTATSVMTTTPPLATFLKNQVSAGKAETTVTQVVNDQSDDSSEATRAALLADPEKLQAMRKDLRAQLQKIVENR